MRLSESRGGAHVHVVGRRAAKTRVWVALGALLIIVGAARSVFAADEVSRGAEKNAQAAIATSAAVVATSLQLAVLRYDDIITSESSYAIGNSPPSQQEFSRWASAARAFLRDPDLMGIGEVEVVPAPAALRRTPGTGVVSSGIVVAAAHAAHGASGPDVSCSSIVGVVRRARDAVPPMYDSCAFVQGKNFLSSRDADRSVVEPSTVHGVALLSIETPIYRGAAIPRTVAARRAAFVGWSMVLLAPATMLASAARGQPGARMTLSFASAGVREAVTVGRRASGEAATTAVLGNGWTLKTFGVVRRGWFSNASALALLIAGIALSSLIGAVIFVLGLRDTRALNKVHEQSALLRFQALHDPLTGLANRLLIIDRVEQLLARSRRTRLPHTAMFLDLDDFKDINDTYGHDAGDQVLVAVGTRLLGVLRREDTVGRLGGDEFIVLVEGSPFGEESEFVANRILDAMEPPFDIAGCDRPVSISVSIGVASGDRRTADELLRDADLALYRAKAAGKHCAVVFDPLMQVAAREHRDLADDLQSALLREQYFLLYQPTIDLQTNAFVGVEALLRWSHPARGVVLPDDFIPALEASGLVVPVGAWVLETACRQGAAWLARDSRISVSVNVSASQLGSDRIIDDVRNALEKSGFEPAMLILELTETTFLNDDDEMVRRLESLKVLGIRLAVDDFGTGYSSLAHLRKFPIDVLKIDRSFVSGIAVSAESAALVHALVQLGKALDLETVAEGIEDDDQRLRLQVENVDIGQGYLFSRPLEVSAVDRIFAISAMRADAAVRGSERRLTTGSRLSS